MMPTMMVNFKKCSMYDKRQRKNCLVYATLVFFIIESTFSQVNGVSLSGGVSYSGKKFSEMQIGGFANIGFPIESSEIRGELSYYEFPYGVESNELYLTTFEIGFHYGGFPEHVADREMLFYIGGGPNLNLFSGGSEVKTTTSSQGYDSTFYGVIDPHIRAGFGLNLGVGWFLSRVSSFYLEYTAKGIFYQRGGIGWGGVRIGFRYQQVNTGF
ncbi:MAG: hypothetical protein EPO24_02985 [Bacteroidetes bacterium]|nr:MAG: hypothetical protein EPO24_02985 [Bacteroidota bacterium]